MTDEHDTPLTPAQDEEVRRLLADARHEAPMPPEVVARMDRVLDDLAAEPGRTAPVVDLATRRRRVASLLVAAAAVVVVGIGLGQVVGNGGGADSGGDAATIADEAGGAEAPSASSPEREAPGESAEQGNDSLLSGPEQLYPLRPDELSADVERLRDSGSYRSLAKTEEQVTGNFRADGTTCRAIDWGKGVLIPISYGDELGGLVLREPLGDTQVADVYLCGDRTPVRSLTLPVP